MFRPAIRSSSRRLLRKRSDEVSSYIPAIPNLMGALYKHWHQSNYIRKTGLIRYYHLSPPQIFCLLLFVIYSFEGYAFKYAALPGIISTFLSH